MDFDYIHFFHYQKNDNLLFYYILINNTKILLYLKKIIKSKSFI